MERTLSCLSSALAKLKSAPAELLSCAGGCTCMSVVGLVSALHTIATEVVEEGVGRTVNWGKKCKNGKGEQNKSLNYSPVLSFSCPGHGHLTDFVLKEGSQAGRGGARL